VERLVRGCPQRSARCAGQLFVLWALPHIIKGHSFGEKLKLASCNLTSRVRLTGLLAFATMIFPQCAGAQSPMAEVLGAPDVHLFKHSSTAVDPSQSLRIGFGLTGFRKQAADAFVADLYDPESPNYHHWIDTSAFGQYFGAPDADTKAISVYLESEGFTDVHVSAGKSYISATGTVQVAQRAFKTTITNFVRPAELVATGEPAVFFGPNSPIQLPANLAPKVVGAFGFCNLAMEHPGVIKLRKRQSGGSGFTPAQLATAYDSTPFEGTNRGQGLTIAVYSPTTRYPNDAVDFANKLGIPKDFTITDVPIGGGATSNQGLLEASIDQEQIIGQAYHAKIYMVEPPTSDAGKLDAYDWVGTNKVPVLTSSWTNKESWVIAEKLQAWATQFENVCESLAAAGTIIFNDAGDAAGFGGSGAVTVGMECACPYVTAVGGTSLSVNSNETWKSETLWEYNGQRSDPVGGAGGISKLFKRPSWQTGYGVTNSYSNGYRELPDVSGNSATNTPYSAVVNGKTNYVAWGTSLATPLWAVNFLLMEQSYSTLEGRAVHLGNINPILYQLGNEFENPTVDSSLGTIFHDITVGNNGVYPTTVGFDLCSGWGSADFGKLFVDYAAAEKFIGYSPDYRPYTPSNWAYPVIFHASAGSANEPTTFEHGTTYTIGACSANGGTADGPSAPFLITIDGTAVALTHILNAEPLHTYYGALNVGTCTFTKGAHTIVFTVNTGSSIYEVNRANNTFTRQITVK
jgi:subtilase family serine protease